MTLQYREADSKTKRKLSNVKLCYHGCVFSRENALTFRQHIDDMKSQVLDLIRAGYTIVPPSTYDDWFNETQNIGYPIAAIDLDDGLDSIIPFCDWMVEEGIPFGLGIISSRNRKDAPDQGFLTWAQLRTWVESGLCELLRHTHNIHNLAITDVDGSASPVLEGPCWIDEPANLVYKTPTETRWYWDFDIIDTTSFGFPLFGSDPYSGFATKINSDVYFRASDTLTVDRLRFWCSLHRPYGGGYECSVEILIDGVSLGNHTISRKHYSTRSQWVEREFYSLTLNSGFNVVAGSNYKITFKTNNVGPAAFLIYALPELNDPEFYATTSCRSLVEGKEGPDHADFPAGRPWPIRAGLILASGSGRQATTAEYSDYIEADIVAQNNAFENWLKADWYETLPTYLEERRRWSIFVLGGCETDGSTVTSIISWVAKRPANYPTGPTTMTLESLRFREAKPIGLRYALIIDIEIGTSVDGPWTKVAEWVPGWAYYKWLTIDIDSTEVTIDATYWFRFVTRTRSYNNDYPSVEDPDDPKRLIPGTNLGKISILLDSPVIQGMGTTTVTYSNTGDITVIEYNGTLGLEQAYLIIDDTFYYTWLTNYGAYYPGFNMVYDQPLTIITPINDASMKAWTSTSTDIDPWLIDLGFFDGIWKYKTSLQTGKHALYGAEEAATYHGTFGQVLLGARVAIRNPSNITYNQIIYPFGAYNQIELSADIVRIPPISPTLQALFDTYDIRSGYTIYPTRCDVVSRFREQDATATEHTMPRLMLYGDRTEFVGKGLISNYTGVRWPDAHHGGGKWQISIEASVFGHSVVKNAYTGLAFVAFDAWFFREPDGLHVNGWIEQVAINDGGLWDGVVYEDEKTFLQSKGVKALLILSNYSSVLDDIDPAIASYVVNNPSEFITDIVNICVDDGWDGITGNLEGIPQADREAATFFYKSLAIALHAVNKDLHITAPAVSNTDYDIGSEWWWGWCNHAELIKYVDAMKIMTYTEHGPGTAPGPHCPDFFFNDVYDHLLTVIPPAYKRRVLVGVNAYGHAWPDTTGNGVEYTSYHESMARAIVVGSEIKFSDGEAHTEYKGSSVWWSCPLTINRAVDKAASLGFGGIGMWKGDDGDVDEFHPVHPQIGYFEMPTFLDITLPDQVSYGFTGGPKYNTSVSESDSGAEQRSARWNTPLHNYRIQMRSMGQAERELLVDTFRMVKGRYASFRFKDWLDYLATDEFLGTADGTTTVYQLRKTYTVGAFSEVRNITKPRDNGSLVVKVNGSPVSNYTIDFVTGVITFDAAPTNGNTLSATFEFDVPVRFDIDFIPITIDNFDNHSAKSISVSEVRV